MTSLLFTAAFVTVVVALGWRSLVRVRARRALHRELEKRAEMTRLVSDYTAIDAAVRAERCVVCDSRLAVVGEGPADGIVVVQLRCTRCGTRLQLRFFVPDA